MTAAVLIPAVLALVLFGSNPHVALGFGLVVVGCAWEWSGLSSWSGALRSAYVLLLAALLYFVWSEPGLAEQAVLVGCLWWGLAVMLVVTYQHRENGWRWLTHPLVLAITGWLILVPAWTALVAIHAKANTGVAALVILFVLVWGADTGAYFAGRRFGKHKLASRVSPGKTWEGIGGAMIAGLAIGGLGGWWLGFDAGTTGRFMVLSAVTVAISVVGDLTESLFKRRAGVKDSGALLPGHGGLLDRVDSLTAAAPVFLFGLGKLL